MLTIKDFLEYYLDDDCGWRLDDDGNLMDGNDRCPLFNAYERRCARDDDDEDYAMDYVEAGTRMGLRTRDAVAIAQAADNCGHPRLRKRLLAKLGVSELPPTSPASAEWGER